MTARGKRVQGLGKMDEGEWKTEASSFVRSKSGGIRYSVRNSMNTIVTVFHSKRG